MTTLKFHLVRSLSVLSLLVIGFSSHVNAQETIAVKSVKNVPTRIVTGSWMETYIHSQGETLRPALNPAGRVRIFQPTGTGTWLVVPFQSAASGSFVATAPIDVKPYWFKRDSSYFWLNQNQVNLNTAWGHRPEIMYADPGTYINVRYRDLPVTAGTRDLELVTPNLGIFGYASSDWGPPPFDGAWTPGFTDVQGIFYWESSGLLSHDKGDKMWAVCTSTMSLPPFTNASRSDLSDSGLEIETPNGSGVGMDRFMISPTPFWSDFHIPAPAFFGLVANQEPKVQATSFTFKVFPYVGSAEGRYGLNQYLPSHLYASLPGVVTSDIFLAGHQVFDPYQGLPGKRNLARGIQSFSTSYQAYGAATPGSITGSAYALCEVVPSGATKLPIPPTPVQKVYVDRAVLDHPLEGVGLTPLIQWSRNLASRPDPTYFRVIVNELYTREGRTMYSRRAMLSTRENSLLIPPGVLESGKQYVFDIQTAREEGVYTLIDGPRNEFNSSFTSCLTFPVLTTSSHCPAIQSFKATGSTTLSWKVLGADRVTITPGIGAVDPTSGTVTVGQSGTYEIRVDNAFGTRTQSCNVGTVVKSESTRKERNPLDIEDHFDF